MNALRSSTSENIGEVQEKDEPIHPHGKVDPQRILHLRLHHNDRQDEESCGDHWNLKVPARPVRTRIQVHCHATSVAHPVRMTKHLHRPGRKKVVMCTA
jgi:hypothetical protein